MASIAVGAVMLAWVGLAVLGAPLLSQWDEVVVRECQQPAGSSVCETVDVYAAPPMAVGAWLLVSLVVVGPYAVAVAAAWVLMRFAAARPARPFGAGRPRWPNAAAATAWNAGLAVLSFYALAVHTGNWRTWRESLDAGLVFYHHDPKPGPLPEYDASQIPWGVAAFVAIPAVSLAMTWALRRLASRRRLVRGPK